MVRHAKARCKGRLLVLISLVLKRANFNSDVDYQAESFGRLGIASTTGGGITDMGIQLSINDHTQGRRTYTDPEHVNVTIAIIDNELDQGIAIESDDELALVESAFEYLTKKVPGCSKNYKRITRRKAERLEERNILQETRREYGKYMHNYNNNIVVAPKPYLSPCKIIVLF